MMLEAGTIIAEAERKVRMTDPGHSRRSLERLVEAPAHFPDAAGGAA
jgi:hypothetical protein